MYLEGWDGWLRKCLLVRKILVALSFCAVVSRASLEQESRLGIDRAHYGVWDRTAFLNGDDYPFTTGQAFSQEWSKTHIARGTYDWTWLDDALQYAYAQGHKCYIKIQPVNGTVSHPAWLASHGVPMFSDGVNTYGDYLDPTFQEIFAEMVMAFGHHVRNEVPAHLQGVVAWCRVESGRSGDEVPFSDHPNVPEAYQISDEEWKAYKLWVYELYDEAFQEGPGYKVPLLFNAIHPHKQPDLWDWCVEHVTEGLGTKYGGMVRGHHLSTSSGVAASYKGLAEDHPMGLFSRNEMDQTWQYPFFQTNIRMGMFWTAVEQLHAGMSVWDVTASCLTRVYEDDHALAFDFFDRWAAELIPETAGGGFCVLHEGLDASDRVKFPESEFGLASQNNAARYTAICAAHAARGARMDDLDRAKVGQLAQRKDQTGLNDSSWEIVAGNYTRFIEQIDPDETSVGHWRVGGTITTNSHPYDRFGRGFDHDSGRNVMYFDVNDDLLDDSARKVELAVYYYDEGLGEFELRYDARGDSEKTALVVVKTDTKTWKKASAVVTDGVFDNRGPKGADFMLVNTDSEDDVFHRVELLKLCDVNIGVAGRGSIRIKHGLNEFERSLPAHMEGYELDLTAIPDQGWEFSGWSGDANGSNETFKLFPTLDTRLTASFEHTGRFYGEDDFNTADFNGGSGWAGGWTSNSDVEFSTNPVNAMVRLYGDGWIERDLSVPVSNAVLRFKRDLDKLDDDDGDYARVEVYDGAWHTAWEVEGAEANGATKALWWEEVDLGAYGRVSKVRFSADIQGGESFYVDNVRLVGYDTNTTSSACGFIADPIAGTDAWVDAAYAGSLASHAQDPDGDPLTFSKLEGPAWLSVGTDGSLAGTPGSADIGLNTFKVRAEDDDGEAEAIVLIRVGSINQSPIFSAPLLTSENAVRGGAYAADISAEATDPNVGDQLVFRKLSGPEWLRVAADGSLSGVPYGTDVGTNVFAVEVFDNGSPVMADVATLRVVVDSELSGTLSLSPTDDCWVSSSSTKLNANYGDNAQLRVGKDAAREAFLRFDVSGVKGKTRSAALRLYSINVDQTVHCRALLEDAWNEFEVTYSNRPAMGAVLDTVYVAPDAWNQFDLSDHVTGDGVWAFGLEGTAGNKNFHSKEGVAGPELLIEFGDSAPIFDPSTIYKANAFEGVAYVGSLANNATDAEDDPVFFSKSAGPDWLTIASDGSLSGTPGANDVGRNEFEVRVESGGSPMLSDVAVLHVYVMAYEQGGAATFVPTDDTWVTSGVANANKGSSDVLRVGGGGARESFLKFDVTGLSGNITSAVLRVFSHDVAQMVHCKTLSDATWGEYDVTYSNRPGMVATLDSVVAVPGSWCEFDVSSWITAEGVRAFGLEGTGANDDFASKESAYVPELVVEYEGGFMDVDPLFEPEFAATSSTEQGTTASAPVDGFFNDDLHFTLTEELGEGDVSRLEHVWTFDVSAGELVTFYVEAHHSANQEGDDFVFAYSTDGTIFSNMFVITKTADDDTAQFHALPSGLSGELHVRVTDMDRSPGNSVLDELRLDAMFVVSESATLPPGWASAPRPSDLSTGVSLNPILSWSRGVWASSHDVYFGTNAVLGVEDFRGNQSDASFVPGPLLPSTTYHWAVDEINSAGAASGATWSFTTEAEAP